MSALSKFLSPEEEPVRRYLYGVGAAVVALLVVVGVITGALGTAILAVVGAALIVPPTAELVRSKVSPVPVLDADPDHADDPTVDYGNELGDGDRLEG